MHSEYFISIVYSVMKLTLVLPVLVGVAAAVPITRELLALEGDLKTQYSSDFTRDIFVKGIHSHNDYWRDVPLYTALSHGVVSVEADVWHFDGDDAVYVGHHEAALTPARTFASLYIDPLVGILTQANPNNSFTAHDTAPNGVWDTDSGQTLYLFVDVKTDGNATWPYVIEALEPLRQKGWLTTFNGTAITSGPITVVGTGNTPYAFVKAQKTRDYFYDGPVTLLNDTEAYPATLNPIASASFLKTVGLEPNDIPASGLNKSQLASLTKVIDQAHELGIYTRFWEVPWWPVEKRNNLWRQLIEAGSDLLNADDIELAFEFY
ncbi:putative secreted protein [Lipomyces japonicus]|uniref:uncharacterized protein n=1 Tax=Lipomyces japonicus TaxID=56871 RepID=UPI0034CD7A0A